jgi:hypothetical protein
MDEAFAILDYDLMAKCLLLESQINSYRVPTKNIVENLQASLKQLSAAADLVIMEQWLFPEKTPKLAVFDKAVEVAQQLGEILKDKSFEETAFHFSYFLYGKINRLLLGISLWIGEKQCSAIVQNQEQQTV